MQQLVSRFKRLNLRQFLIVILAGFVLLLNTACNNGNVQGARPNNPPVQMGGNNNPHKAGGDGYTNYRMSTDPKANQHSSLEGFTGMVLAAADVKSSASDLIYPGSNASDEGHDIGTLQTDSLPPLPNPKQPMLDRSNPDAKILERVGEAFNDASSFIKDTADSASARPEAKANPARGQ